MQRAEANAMTTGSGGRQELNELLASIEYAMFTARSRDGELISRPLQTLQVDGDGTIWFFTSAASAKLDDIAADARVNLAYADPVRKRFASVAGTAEVVNDRAKIAELWSPAQTVFFPRGRDDPSLVLLKVTPATARIWDGRESMLGLLFKFGKALLRGEPSDLGRREDLDLRRPGNA